MKKLVYTLLVGLPLVANAYTLTIQNNSSITMKIKNVPSFNLCLKVSPKKVILRARESGTLDYSFYSSEEECKGFNHSNLRLLITGYPVTAEDPEFESFSYYASYHEKDLSNKNTVCQKRNSKLYPYHCYSTYMNDNDQDINYKITADFENIYVSDK